MSSGACQRSQVQRVNDNKKVCKWACCCRGVIHNNERGAGKCGVKCLMEMSGVRVRTHVAKGFIACFQCGDDKNFFLFQRYS